MEKVFGKCGFKIGTVRWQDGIVVSINLLDVNLKMKIMVSSMDCHSFDHYMALRFCGSASLLIWNCYATLTPTAKVRGQEAKLESEKSVWEMWL